VRTLLLLLLPVLAGCAAIDGTAAGGSAPLEVEVFRRGAVWTADFHFNRDAPVWVFARSPLADSDQRPWRPKSWTVETEGARLERLGRYDVLASTRSAPVPRHVRVTFTPFSGDVTAGYNPALVFTDGSVALFSEQFAAFPIGSRQAARLLPLDLEEAHLPGSLTRTRYRDAASPVLHAGRRMPSVTLDSAESGTYVLFGRAEPLVTGTITTVIDPQLPEWLRGALTRSTPAILDSYAAALGPLAGPRPMILANWRGASPQSVVMSGSALPGLIVMSFEGERLLKEDSGARARTLWFIAHEAAHFWLGQTVRHAGPADAWIVEGGADLLAARAVAAIDPAFDWRAELQREVDDCVTLTVGRGIESAVERSEFRAHYACGAIFGLVAEASSGRPFAQFVRTLIDANRADGVVTRTDWLSALDSASGDPSLSADIERLLHQGVPDPKAMIASLFLRAGIRHTIASDGVPKLS
jgi:hypothetical protein